MPKIIAIIAIAIATAALGAGCSVPLVDAQANVADICITYPNLMIPAVDAGATTLDHTFVVTDLSAVQSLAMLVTDLEFVSVDAHAVTGITDFTFVEAAHVSIASGDPTSPLPTLDVYDCDGDCVPMGDSLSVPAGVQTSALAYVESGSVLVDLVIDGQLPIIDWSMNMDVCFRGDVGYQQNL